MAYNLFVVAVSGMAATGRFQYSPIGFGRGVFFYRFIRERGGYYAGGRLFSLRRDCVGRYARGFLGIFCGRGLDFSGTVGNSIVIVLGYVIIASHYVTGDIIASCPIIGHVEQAMVL